MPMPHRTQLQVIKRRIQDKTGPALIRELRAVLAELPDYRNGPYADLRKWVQAQIVEAQARGRVVHHDSINVKRQGAAQVALVGAPNAGKSSLLQALSAVQVKTGDYAFTTTRPVPAVIRAGGALVQLVEIPGLIDGAATGRGGGRALLGVLRGADAMVLCHAATEPAEGLLRLRSEVGAAGIDLPAVVAVTKYDEAGEGVLEHVREAVPDLPVTAVSAIEDESLDRFRETIWRLVGLVRVYLRHGDVLADQPLTLAPPVTVADVAAAIHGELESHCRGARLWGPSAAFDGQRVGRRHPVADGDIIEIEA